MKERPIPFSAPMVRALLNGSKTQTRRAFRDQPPPGVTVGWVPGQSVSPYGKPGDRLWVREAWKAHTTFDSLPPRDIPQTKIWYVADDGYKAESRHRQGMFMPRWASRILLEVVSVRVERLQDISRSDAMAEGCPFPNMAAGDDPRKWFADLWQQINGADSWATNPWVWVVEFKRVPIC